MQYSLNAFEREVVINLNDGEETAELYTASPVWIRKLDKLVASNPENFQMFKEDRLEGRVVARYYRFPKSLITIRSKKPAMSEDALKRKIEALMNFKNKRENRDGGADLTE